MEDAKYEEVRLEAGEEVTAVTTAHVADLSKNQQKELKKFFKWDSLVMTGTVINIMASGFILGRVPAFMWVVHIIKMVIYLPSRFFRFREWKGQLYLLEFCYFVSYYSVVGIILAYLNTHKHLSKVFEDVLCVYWKTCFALANGTVGWAVFLFRSSIVFHDPDQLTTTFIHLSPPLMFWTLRWGGGLGRAEIEDWWPGMFELCPGEILQEQDPCIYKLWCDSCPASLWEMGAVPFLYYLLGWALPYYLIMFVLLPGYIERHGMETLFKYTYFDGNGDPKDSLMTRKLPRSLWPIGHMGQHGLLTLVSGFCSWFMWHSFWLHTAFIVSLILYATFNGATYTFEIFSMRYADQVLKRHTEILQN